METIDNVVTWLDSSDSELQKEYEFFALKYSNNIQFI